MIELQLVENEPKTFESAMRQEMEKPIKHFERELVKIRTGRAHTSMIEDLPVSIYGGAAMPLKQIASLSAADARMLTVSPWDKSTIGDIEKAIANSNLGVVPQNDGEMIKIVLPEMSRERREDLVKVLGKKAEESKVAIRNIRKDFNNLIRDAKKDKTISENFFNRLSDILQKITDEFIAKVDTAAKKKEKDITSI